MTVSNPASFSSIKAEFGGSNNFKDYYRGGPYVPSSSPTQISTTADGLSMSQFNGVSKPATYVANASPSTVSGGRSTQGTASTGSSVVTVTGNVGSVTYLWQYVSGDTVVACVFPNNSSTSWQAGVSGTNTDRSTVWRCKVTDSVGNVTYSNNVYISLTFTG